LDKTFPFSTSVCLLDTDNYLLHGEAVGIGMVAEAKASVFSGLINEGELKNIEKVLLNAGLPVRKEISDPEKVLELISNDKKSDKGQVKWTLLKGLGQAIIDRELSPEILRKSLEYISGKNE
jgi:3-dehydroquinate synthase